MFSVDWSVEAVVNANRCVEYCSSDHVLGPLQRRRLVIGSFSAASNVTGIVTDVHAVSEVILITFSLPFCDWCPLR
eukprot:4584569-Pyramimonas_sp.AAC.1